YSGPLSRVERSGQRSLRSPYSSAVTTRPPHTSEDQLCCPSLRTSGKRIVRLRSGCFYGCRERKTRHVRELENLVKRPLVLDDENSTLAGLVGEQRFDSDAPLAEIN